MNTNQTQRSEESEKFIAKRYGTTEGNLYNWLKKRGLKPTKI